AVAWVGVVVTDGDGLVFPPEDQTANVVIQRSALRTTPDGSLSVQKVTVTNNVTHPIVAPLILVVEERPQGGFVPDAGVTRRIKPSGVPWVSSDVTRSGLLRPGESVTAEMACANPDGVPISYVPRVLSASRPA